ncbi:MAG: flagellar assembly protein FliH [Clostridia bacterium]|nr:flagellar assembly protein FliH [Clostridia bacterium]
MLLLSKVIKEPPVPRVEKLIPLKDLKVIVKGNPKENLIEKATPASPEQIIAAAREEAEAIRAAAQAESEARRQEGYQAGWQAGYHEARAAAEEEANKIRSEAEALRREAEEFLREARHARQEIIKSAEKEALELALKIAEKILGRQVELNPQVTLDLARQAVREVAEGEVYIIYASPGDAELLRQRRAELEQELKPAAALQIVADPAIKPGGCRIETENGFIDTTFERQLEVLKEALQAGRHL